jgi:hypothetical protein
VERVGERERGRAWVSGTRKRAEKIGGDGKGRAVKGGMKRRKME